MGRCYEFGVSIAEGCEHAMAVSAEGGYCQCPSCGTSCPGRFTACADVVAVPGYVPPGAPRTPSPGEGTSRRGVLPTRRPANPPANEVPAAGVVRLPAHMLPESQDPELAEVRSMLQALIDRPERAVQAIQTLNAGMATRDEELVEVFNRLMGAYQALTEEVRADHAARAELVAAVDRLAQRIADAGGRDSDGRNRFAG